MSSDAVAIISTDWTPLLVKAPHLIKQLGFCISLAATREAAQIQLSGPSLEYKDLASNLLLIANKGQNAFMEAYSDMLQIGNKTNNMSRSGGTLDQLLDLFGDTSADRATNRLLTRLQGDIKACDERGRRTAGEFGNWLQGVQELHRAVLGAQNETNQNLGAAENEMKALNANVARMNNDISKVQDERQLAQEKHAEALQRQAEREAMLNSASVQIAKVGITAGYGLIGAIVGTGVSTYLSSSAAKVVQSAEAELARKRKDARELEHELKEVEIDLGMYQTSAQGLNYLLKAICAVLGLLENLTQNIVALVFYFKQMNTVIEELVTEHKAEVKQIADDQAKGIELNASDYEAFHRSAKQMKKLALTVHSLSALYSSVITDIINPGFSLVVASAHHVDGSSALVVAQKQEGMKQYLNTAEEQCRQAAQTANTTLRRRIEEIDREVPNKRQQKLQKGVVKKTPGLFQRFMSRSS